MSVQDSTTSAGRSVNEAKIEHLLSEKLMEGYVLLDSSCPVCSTPLVKNNNVTTKKNDSNTNMTKPVVLSSSSFNKPFKPVDGVPVCVICRSHVVTHESEISILERCDSLKDKGSILLALYSSSSSATTGDGESASKYTTDSAPVVISVESQEREGEDNVVEVLPSPREGQVEKPIYLGDVEEEEDWVPLSDEEPSGKSKISFDDTTVQDPSIIQHNTNVNDVMEEYSVRYVTACKTMV